jgi:hypothetical protein
LQLPNESWIDIKGSKHPYVFVQIDGVNSDLEYIGINSDKGISFDLLTVTDDSPCCSQSEKVSVSINVIHDGQIEVIITGFKFGTFSYVNTDEKISEICEFIKNSILLSMTAVSHAACHPIYQYD